MSDDAPYTPGATRYTSATFLGRLRNICSQLNPAHLLTPSAEVDAAKDLLSRHRRGEAKASNAELWAAAELCAARVHPDTGENIALPLCFAAYTPMQPPIILGMLWPGGGALNQAFWQVSNQCYNSAVFFANKNKSSEVSDADAMLSFGGSVAAALGLGVGVNRLGARLGNPRVSQFAGFVGCVGAGWTSLLLMRRDELANGVNVADADGTVHGSSHVAGPRGSPARAPLLRRSRRRRRGRVAAPPRGATWIFRGRRIGASTRETTAAAALRRRRDDDDGGSRPRRGGPRGYSAGLDRRRGRGGRVDARDDGASTTAKVPRDRRDGGSRGVLRSSSAGAGSRGAGSRRLGARRRGEPA